jgi:TetR/AcrR family transcriptional repressor of nem operon
MARTKEFDCDQALENAMRLFWEKGYEATSIEQIVCATGVNRASLYGTFGGKRELFDAALKRFQDHSEHELDRIAEGAAPGLAKIREVFRSVGRETLDDARGCFVVNTLAELSVCNPDIARLGKSTRKHAEKFFEKQLREARDLGEIPPGRNPRALGCFLANALFGLRMIAKTQPEARVVQDIVTSTLATLT